MPGVHVEEGGDVVETEGRDDGDEDDADAVGREELFEVGELALDVGGSGEGSDEEVEREDDEVKLDDGEDGERDDVGAA